MRAGARQAVGAAAPGGCAVRSAVILSQRSESKDLAHTKSRGYRLCFFSFNLGYSLPFAAHSPPRKHSWLAISA